MRSGGVEIVTPRDPDGPRRPAQPAPAERPRAPRAPGGSRASSPTSASRTSSGSPPSRCTTRSTTPGGSPRPSRRRRDDRSSRNHIDGRATRAARRHLPRRHRPGDRVPSTPWFPASEAADVELAVGGRASAPSRAGRRRPPRSARASCCASPTRWRPDLEEFVRAESIDSGKPVAPGPLAGHPARGGQPALLRDRDPAHRLGPVPDRRPSPQLHAAAAARRGRAHLARGTCRCTCSPGRSRRPSRPATRSSPSRPS